VLWVLFTKTLGYIEALSEQRLKMAKKYYVVWQGRETGIYQDWPSCKRQVDKFAGARYKSFASLAEAEAAFGAKASSRPKAAPAAKRPRAAGLKTYQVDEIAKLAAEVKIYTDGGCEPNPGEAGSGLALYRNERLAGLWYGLYHPRGTNNSAELNALNQALILAQQELDKGLRVVILCDSQYAIQCLTQWADIWQKKGWKKPSGEIKNLALIQQMYARYQLLKACLPILHVNGHVGLEGNELADRMSILAISEKQTEFRAYPDLSDIKALLALRAG